MLIYTIPIWHLGSVTSTDSGLGFYDHRLNNTNHRIYHHHHSQQPQSQHGKNGSAGGKVISVTGNSNGTKGTDSGYKLSSSSSIKEQRKQQALLQQQRQQRKKQNGLNTLKLNTSKNLNTLLHHLMLSAEK